MAEISQDVTTVVEPTVIEGRNIVILYGSETGNAEDIALELSNMTRRLHFKTVVDEMDNIKLTELVQCQLAIFVTSTTGQGDLPRNTAKFWANLRRTRLNNTNCLGALKFTIFGLGDSSYPNVNAAERKLRSRLKQLGATEFFRAGEGDERHENGIDSAYMPWSKELREYLVANYPLPEPLQPLDDEIHLPPRYNLVFEMASTASPVQAGSVEGRFDATKELAAEHTHVDRVRSNLFQLHLDHKVRGKTNIGVAARDSENWENQNPRLFGSLDKDNVLTDHYSKYLLQEPSGDGQNSIPSMRLLDIPKSIHAVVRENTRLTPESHWQDVRHIKLQVSFQKEGEKQRPVMLPYLAGATAVIYPKNFPEDVQSLIDMMGWGSLADTKIKREFSCLPKKLYPFEDGPATFRDLLTHSFDITAVPKRSFLREMAQFAENMNEKERLTGLTKFDSQQEFYDYTSRPRRTILEVLRDFPSVKIPLRSALEMFPLIRGREYSICNGAFSISKKSNLNTIDFEIIAALVEYKTVIRKPRKGLCSRYLERLPIDAVIKITLNPPSTPTLRPENMLLVSSNETGERPLIAVATGTGIAPIRALLSDRRRAEITAPALVFFGCRNEKADFFFESERQKERANPTEYWGDNVRVIPAFSRDENPTQVEPNPAVDLYGRIIHTEPPNEDERPDAFDFDRGKNYVQHQIKKHAYEVASILTGDVPPIICVCGNSGNMPNRVREAFEYVLISQKIVARKEEAREWLNNKNNVVYWQETW